MQQDTGLFIALEGIDGAGKTTQCHLLRRRLVAAGYSVAYFDFPQYTEPSSHFVKQYLDGAYGKPGEVGPYRASLLYALDRFDAAPLIREALVAGKIVLANRFTGSNMAYQGAKIASPEERRGYYIWLDNLEFEILGLARPTLSLVLELPSAIAQRQNDTKPASGYISKRRKPAEADVQLTARTATTYDELTQLFPRDFQAIDCVRGGELLDAETIHGLVWGKIEPLLPIVHDRDRPASSTATPEPKTSEARTSLSVLAALHASVHHQLSLPDNIVPIASDVWFYTPAKLEPEIREIYESTMGRLRAMYDEMAPQLATHLVRLYSTLKPGERDQMLQPTLQLVLPLAALTKVESENAAHTLNEDASHSSSATDTAMRDLAEASLPANHAGQGEAVQLTSFWPRNELDLVPEMLYEFSDQPLEAIKQAVTSWQYDQKSAALRTYVAGRLERGATDKCGVLDSVRYSWDLVSDVPILRALALQTGALEIEWQPLSPRLGYDVPDLIDQAGLTDSFEQCFDLSLQLYSQLQQAGLATEAQYAVLLGHRLRWKATYSARKMFNLRDLANGSSSLQELMNERMAEIHPLLAESFSFTRQANSKDEQELDK